MKIPRRRVCELARGTCTASAAVHLVYASGAHKYRQLQPVLRCNDLASDEVGRDLRAAKPAISTSELPIMTECSRFLRRVNTRMRPTAGPLESRPIVRSFEVVVKTLDLPPINRAI